MAYLCGRRVALLPSTLVLLWVLAACASEPVPVDQDLDGWSSAVDCDDGDAQVHPKAAETCNGVDDDCDQRVDRADAAFAGASAWYRDADGDGFGVAEEVVWRCEPFARGASEVPGDCDDADVARNPDATEVCNAVDDDCDGDVDTADDSLDGSTAQVRYVDADGDGFGAGEDLLQCAPFAQDTVDNGEDCDDADPHTSPQTSEWVTGCYTDADGDGYGDDAPTGLGVDAGTDCDDADPLVAPWRTEHVPGCYLDADGDGFGEDAPLSPDITPGSDCDDTNARTYDGAARFEPRTACTRDVDGDGYGDAAPPVGVDAGEDCDDVLADVHPRAVDAWYDGVDSNCDGVDDWDRDGDGHEVLSAPGGGSDCDDLRAAVSPDATERCGGVDEDCDGFADDADPDIDYAIAGGHTFFADADQDGEGDALTSTLACVAPAGWVMWSGDCDDTDASVGMHAARRERGIFCSRDVDGDDFGDVHASGIVTPGTDCDDTRADVNPGAIDWIDDGVDQDCDGHDDPCPGARGCPATSCAEVQAALGAGAAERYVWIDLGGAAPELVECDLHTDGGAWMLVARVAMDGVQSWALGAAGPSVWGSSTRSFGAANGVGMDYRSAAAFNVVAFTDVMFVEGDSAAPLSSRTIWAAYHGVGDGQQALGAWLDQVVRTPVCYGARGGFVMSAGTLRAEEDQGSVRCSTDLYVSPLAQEGTSSCAGTGVVGAGFTWSVSAKRAWGDPAAPEGCPLFAPASAGLGPQVADPTSDGSESWGLSFGVGLPPSEDGCVPGDGCPTSPAIRVFVR